MPTKLIVFDCDGVLVDSEVLVIEIEAAMLSAAGFPISSSEIAERFVGLSYPTMMTALEAEHGRPVPEELNQAIQQAALDTFPSRLEPVEGIPKLLESLQAERCVASSSDLDRVVLSLSLCDIDHHFASDRLFSAQMVANGKPAPDLFLHAATALGVDPHDCLVIEDRPHGVTAAVAAGMSVVGLVAGGHTGPALADRLRTAGASEVFATDTDLADHLDLVS